MSDPQNHTRENEVDKEKVSGRKDERVCTYPADDARGSLGLIFSSFCRLLGHHFDTGIEKTRVHATSSSKPELMPCRAQVFFICMA